MRLLDADTGLGLDALAMGQTLSGEGQVTALNPHPLFVLSSHSVSLIPLQA
jgi:hypothetical protein